MASGEATRLVAARYRIDERLGAGGMGTVWRGWDEVLRRPVAVKEVIVPAGTSEADAERMRARYLREARAAARLHHPGVVGVYDVIADGPDPEGQRGRVWIVMELLDARDLAALVRAEGPQSPQQSAEIGLQLVEALAAAHKAGVLHRDVKPANVLICEPDTHGARRAVLTDFGVASIVGDPSVTGTGQLYGSPAYLPPERLVAGGTLTEAADLWSLGCTLYAATEGHPPFPHEDPFEVVTAITLDPVPEPEHAGPLSPVLFGLLHKDPAQRWDAATTRAALRDVLDGKPVEMGGGWGVAEPEPVAEESTSDETPTAVPAKPAKPKRRLVDIALLLGLAAALLAVVLVITQQLTGWPELDANADDTRPPTSGPSASFSTYGDTQGRYTIDYPAGWNVICPGLNTCRFNRLAADRQRTAEAEDAMSLYVIVRPGERRSPRSLNDAESARNGQMFAQYSVILDGQQSIGAHKGFVLEYTFVADSGQLRHVKVFRTTGPDRAIYEISLNGPDEEFRRNQDVYTDAINSLKFT